MQLGAGTSSWLSGQGGTQPSAFDAPQWDIDDLGMWSLVLNPLSRGIVRLREVAIFFARNEHRSPSMTIVRRLCLDVSFLLSVITIVRGLWIRSGVRRREVKIALIILWRAIVGSTTPRNYDYYSPDPDLQMYFVDDILLHDLEVILQVRNVLTPLVVLDTYMRLIKTYQQRNEYNSLPLTESNI
jgi:hypothetical protein